MKKILLRILFFTFIMFYITTMTYFATQWFTNDTPPTYTNILLFTAGIFLTGGVGFGGAAFYDRFLD